MTSMRCDVLFSHLIMIYAKFDVLPVITYVAEKLV